MPAKRFNEADIDFDALDGELAKLEPPKLSLTDVMDRLRKRLVKQQAKGVTVAQMHEVLKWGLYIRLDGPFIKISIDGFSVPLYQGLSR